MTTKEKRSLRLRHRVAEKLGLLERCGCCEGIRSHRDANGFWRTCGECRGEGWVAPEDHALVRAMEREIQKNMAAVCEYLKTLGAFEPSVLLIWRAVTADPEARLKAFLKKVKL